MGCPHLWNPPIYVYGDAHVYAMFRLTHEGWGFWGVRRLLLRKMSSQNHGLVYFYILIISMYVLSKLPTPVLLLDQRISHKAAWPEPCGSPNLAATPGSWELGNIWFTQRCVNSRHVQYVNIYINTWWYMLINMWMNICPVWYMLINWLVVWFGTFFIFPFSWESSSQLTHIFPRGGPTTNQVICVN